MWGEILLRCPWHRASVISCPWAWRQRQRSRVMRAKRCLLHLPLPVVQEGHLCPENCSMLCNDGAIWAKNLFFIKENWKAEFWTMEVPVCSVTLFWGRCRNFLGAILSVFASLRAVSSVLWRKRACWASVVRVKQRFSQCGQYDWILWYSVHEPNKRNLVFEKSVCGSRKNLVM